MPFFDHSFEPSTSSSIGNRVELTTREVEDAGLMEVLQTPGARLGTWSIFNALLDSTTDDFVFNEPLGQSREIKVALSGLFGRFVARAYATRYLGYNYFNTIHGELMPTGVGGCYVRRILSGDRPDWVASGPGGLAIIEAKGCHHYRDPRGAIEKAFEQTARVRIEIGGRIAAHKRFAIATRWGFSNPYPTQPMLWVKDPPEAGDDIEPEGSNRVHVGIARRHSAALLKALNKSELADLIFRLASCSVREEAALKAAARTTLQSSQFRSLDTPRRDLKTRQLVGSYVTRAGIVDVSDISVADQETLTRLKMQPTFIGLEREVLSSIVEGDLSQIARLDDRERSQKISRDMSGPTTDGAGSWVLRFDSDDGQLR